MSLSPGDHLGPYEITGAVGAGGMGEVKGDQFVAERARPWSSARIGARGWALHPDGMHVAATPPLAQAFVKQDSVVVVTNFLDEVRRRTARKK